MIDAGHEHTAALYAKPNIESTMTFLELLNMAAIIQIDAVHRLLEVAANSGLTGYRDIRLISGFQIIHSVSRDLMKLISKKKAMLGAGTFGAKEGETELSATGNNLRLVLGCVPVAYIDPLCIAVDRVQDFYEAGGELLLDLAQMVVDADLRHSWFAACHAEVTVIRIIVTWRSSLRVHTVVATLSPTAHRAFIVNPSILQCVECVEFPSHPCSARGRQGQMVALVDTGIHIQSTLMFLCGECASIAAGLLLLTGQAESNKNAVIAWASNRVDLQKVMECIQIFCHIPVGTLRTIGITLDEHGFKYDQQTIFFSQRCWHNKELLVTLLLKSIRAVFPNISTAQLLQWSICSIPGATKIMYAFQPGGQQQQHWQQLQQQLQQQQQQHLQSPQQQQQQPQYPSHGSHQVLESILVP
jgi:hypothetical protein